MRRVGEAFGTVAKVLSVVGILVLLPLVGAIVTLRSQWGQDKLKTFLAEVIRKELRLNAHFGRVYLDWLPGSVSAANVVLEHPQHGPVLRLRHLRIRPSLQALYEGQLDLRAIEIDRPEVSLLIRDGKLINGPHLRQRTGGSKEVPFHTLLATNGKLFVNAQSLGEIRLYGLNVHLHKRRGGDLDVRFSATAGAIKHPNGYEAIQRLSADGVVLQDRVELREFAFRTPFLSFGTQDAVIPFRGNAFEGNLFAKVDLDHLQTLPMPFEVPRVSGGIEWSGPLSFGPKKRSGDGTLKLHHIQIDRWGLGSTTTRIHLTNQKVELKDGEILLEKEGGALDVQGSIGLSDEFPMDINLRLRGLRFERLMEQLSVTPNAIVAWNIDGTATLKGTLNPLKFGGPTRLDTHHFAITQDAWHEEPRRFVVSVPHARISSTVNVREDAIRFDRIVADMAHSRLQGNVLIGFHNALAVDVRSSNLDFADVSPLAGFPTSGLSSVQVDVGGTLQEPTLTGHVNVHDFSFDSMRLGDVESDAVLEKGGLAIRFPRVQAKKKTSEYHADDLVLDFSGEKFLTETTVFLDRVTLADIYHVFGYENDERFLSYQGVSAGTAHLRYTRKFPGDSPTGTLRTDLDIRFPELSVHDVPFTNGLFQGQWRWLHYDQGYRGGELNVDHFSMRKGDGTVVAVGKMGLAGALNFTVVADQISIQAIKGSASQLSGVGAMTGRVEGTAEVPRAYMDMQVSGLGWAGTSLGDAHAYIRLTDDQDPWVTQARSWKGNRTEQCAYARTGLAQNNWPADPPLRTRDGPEPALIRPMAYLVCGSALHGRIWYDLTIGRTKTYPLRGKVTIDHFAFDPLIPRTPASEGVGGTLSAELMFEQGAMLEPDSLVANLSVSHLRLGRKEVELRNEGPLMMRLDHGALNIGQARFLGPASSLGVTGLASMRRGLSLDLDGRIDLGLVATLFPTVTEAKGDLQLRVHIGGPMTNPSVHGQASVHGGKFRFASFPEPIEHLEARAVFNERRVIFEEVQAAMAGGHLSLTGSSTLQDATVNRYEFDVRARDLTFVPVTGAEIGLGGHLRLQWNRPERLPLLSGTLRVERAVYTKPFDFALTFGEITHRQRVQVERYDPEADRVALDLRLVQEAPFRIANNIVDAEVRIEDSERPFRIVGTDQRFGVLGNLVIPRGLLRIRSTQFDVQRGNVEFEDPFRIDPHFDIRAATDVRRTGDTASTRWRVNLHAHGSRDSMELTMKSEPDLSQEDLLLLLTVGMTRTEAQQLQAGNVTGTAALEALAAVTGLDRRVQRAVPVIDDFRLSSAYSVQTGRTEPQVVIGKRLTPRMRLSAQTGLAQSRDFRAALIWQLGSRTTLQAIYDTSNSVTASRVGNVGGELRWRLEFE